MSIGAALLGLAILVLVLAYLARPLIWDSMSELPRLNREQSSLLAERDRVLALLEELEMDRAMHRMSEPDYLLERTRWVKEGARILRQLDELGVAVEPQPVEGAAGPEAALEAQVQAIKAQLGSEPAAQFCPACGNAVEPLDAFCAACGATLTTRAPG